MTREEAIKTLKENVCANCAYCMPFDTCDMSYCDNREAIKVLEQEQYYKDLANSYEKTINKLTKAISEQEPKAEWIPIKGSEKYWIGIDLSTSESEE